MERTNNFDLKIYEGTDKFNPLLFENENMGVIDSVMFALQGLAVESATELKSGSVHAVTRLNGESPLFRFTATSNWTAGDTMTIDGAQVSVFTPSGEALGTGSYVIGTEVIGAVIGTRVTLYVTSGAVAVAEDSEKLGGQLPEYYATKVQNELAMQTATAAGTLSEQNQQQINEINQKLGASRKLLWTNQNPNSAFSSNIILDNDDYDELEIIFKPLSNNQIDRFATNIQKGSRLFITYVGTNTGSAPIVRQRIMNRVSDTEYAYFSNSSTVQNTNSTSRSEDNNSMIPLEIYGIKYLL